MIKSNMEQVLLIKHCVKCQVKLVGGLKGPILLYGHVNFAFETKWF